MPSTKRMMVRNCLPEISLSLSLLTSTMRVQTNWCYIRRQDEEDWCRRGIVIPYCCSTPSITEKSNSNTVG
jgi:hypothetical protein